MLKYSSEEVKPLEYIELVPQYYKIYFRENITQTQDNVYSYNEYEITQKSEDIDKDIELNKEIWLEVSKRNEQIRFTNEKTSLLKKQLTNTDYQVIKCIESYMLGSVLPYDFSELLYNRIGIRNEINNLQNDELTTGDSLDEERNKKIIEMMAYSQTTITNGIDYNEKHYRLNTTDQINLITLYSLAAQGKSVPYHADDEVCRVFTPDEIVGLVNAASAWIIYHTTYFNLLKHQILEMDDIQEIQAVEYGIELKQEYQDIINEIVNM